jgi:predicted amidohydrolase
MVASSENEERLLAVSIDPAQASRKESMHRVEHPILSKFWEAGKDALQSNSPSQMKYDPLLAPEVDIRLSIAQMSCNAGVDANVARMTAMIVEAARGGSDVVAFPELAVTGVSERDVRNADAGVLAQALQRIQQAARESQVCVVFGMPHIVKGKLTNAAFVVGPDGSLLTRYDQLAVNRHELFQPGEQASAMWFRVKGVPAVVTIGHDGLWSEVAELTALAGAHLHVHITNETGSGRDASLRRLQIWANLASWGTFTATANAAAPAGGGGSAIWEDLHRREETALAKDGKMREGHQRMAIYSPFCANCLIRAGEREQIVSAVERMNLRTLHHSMSKNPQMAAWYTLGARIVGPPREW